MFLFIYHMFVLNVLCFQCAKIKNSSCAYCNIYEHPILRILKEVFRFYKNGIVVSLPKLSNGHFHHIASSQRDLRKHDGVSNSEEEGEADFYILYNTRTLFFRVEVENIGVAFKTSVAISMLGQWINEFKMSPRKGVGNCWA